MFTQLRLRPGEGVRGSGDDLENCFYQIGCQTNWGFRCAFGRRVSGPEAAEVGGDPLESYYLCLQVVAMGDLNAVDVVQTTHEAVLENGALPLELLAQVVDAYIERELG